jgi:hypothetical protein
MIGKVASLRAHCNEILRGPAALRPPMRKEREQIANRPYLWRGFSGTVT